MRSDSNYYMERTLQLMNKSAGILNVLQRDLRASADDGDSMAEQRLRTVETVLESLDQAAWSLGEIRLSDSRETAG